MSIRDKIAALTSTEEKKAELLAEICDHCREPESACGECRVRPLLTELLKAERTKATAELMVIVGEEMFRPAEQRAGIGQNISLFEGL